VGAVEKQHIDGAHNLLRKAAIGRVCVQLIALRIEEDISLVEVAYAGVGLDGLCFSAVDDLLSCFDGLGAASKVVQFLLLFEADRVCADVCIFVEALRAV